MRQIVYPQNNSFFEDEYYNNISKENEIKVNTFLLGIPALHIPITFKDLLTSPFEDLINLQSILEPYLKSKTIIEREEFKKYFDYNSCQPMIASFFMDRKKDLHLKTCYYCNIDFINSFEDFGEYKDELHFINKASYQELKIIIPEGKSKLIYDELKRRSITHFDELLSIGGIGKGTINNLKAFKLNDLKKNRNHFTLDHFIPKARFPYFSLSLYNLIPSCYSCNAKFKGAMEFSDINNLNSLSPSSKSFSLFKDLEFKLYFNVPGIYFKKKIKNVNVLEDIRVDIENIGGVKEFDTYLDMFKLKGRYVYHKKESLKLLQKRKRYSDTEIFEIAKITGRDVHDIKKDLFGSIIFDDEEENEPFAKYKRDIAKQLRITK